jgi:hypothetical protein
MTPVNIKAGHFLWLSIPALYLISMRWGMAQSGLFWITLAFIAGAVIAVLLIWIKKTFLRNKKNNFIVNWLIYLTLGLLALVFWMMGFFAGNKLQSDNFNSCVTNGEQVRVALQNYFQTHQTYPVTLQSLDAELPCGVSQSSFYPSVLTYEHTANSYTLYFGDDFASHTATESKPFEAHK